MCLGLAVVVLLLPFMMVMMVTIVREIKKKDGDEVKIKVVFCILGT